MPIKHGSKIARAAHIRLAEREYDEGINPLILNTNLITLQILTIEIRNFSGSQRDN